MYGCFGALRAATGEAVPSRWQHVMVLGNIKGALSMAAVLSLPSGFPDRERLVAIVFGVTFITLMTQALPFQRILKLLKVTLSAADAGIDAAKAMLVAARRGQAELDDLLEAGLVSRRDHAERRAVFQRRVIDAEATLQGRRGEAARDHVVEVSLLAAQKAALLDAARRGLIGGETAQAQVNEIDRALLDLSSHEGDGEGRSTTHAGQDGEGRSTTHVEGGRRRPIHDPR